MPLELKVYAKAEYYLEEEVENVPYALPEDLAVTVELVSEP